MPKKKTLSTSLHLRIDTTTLHRLTELSRNEHRSLSNAARKILEETLTAYASGRTNTPDIRTTQKSGVRP